MYCSTQLWEREAGAKPATCDCGKHTLCTALLISFVLSEYRAFEVTLILSKQSVLLNHRLCVLLREMEPAFLSHPTWNIRSKISVLWIPLREPQCSKCLSRGGTPETLKDAACLNRTKEPQKTECPLEMSFGIRSLGQTQPQQMEKATHGPSSSQLYSDW